MHPQPKRPSAPAALSRAALLGGILLVLAACQQQTPAIDSYEQCVEAGYPQLKIYPGQCVLPDGTRFTQAVTPAVPAAGEPACANQCGNGQCQEMVCMAVGCPCAETAQSCPQDCGPPAQ